VIGTGAPRLQQLYAEWQAWRGERELPSRADFDPLQLKYMIGRLSLLDVLHDPLRFHYRVHGTEVADRFGFDMTGKSLDAWPDAGHRALIHENFVKVVDGRTPLVQQRERTMSHGRVQRYVALVLPLSSHGMAVDMLMIGVEFI
jgi:hypothetical protein